MASSTLSSFWKEQASATLPGNSATTCATISSALIASIVVESGSVNNEHLLQCVAAQAETQRLERDHFVGRDVAEVDARPELLDEPGLRGLARCFEDDVLDTDRLRDVGDEL